MPLRKIKSVQFTTQDAVKQFIAFKQAQNVSARTMRDYNFYLAEFIRKTSNSLDYATLTQDTLQYFADIPNTSPAVFNHRYSNISAFFNWCVKQEIIPKNPLTVQGLTKKRDDGNIKPASIQDVKILLNSFDKTTYTGLRNYTLTLLMLDTGIRTSELIQLRNSDFDQSAKQIIIRKTVAKTRLTRILYLSSQTNTAIAQFIKIKPDDWEDWLFPTNEGKYMRITQLDSEYRRACGKVGIKFTPYQLRHTFATYFVQNGGDLFTLQDLMGHSDLRMTRRYTEIDNQTKKQQHDINSPINALTGNPRLRKIK